jgi:hypothetical protein
VPHRDAVVDRDRVELARDRARRAHRVGDDAADVGQVDVAGDELGEAVRDRDNRLAEVLGRYPGGAQQSSRPRHVPTVRDRA